MTCNHEGALFTSSSIITYFDSWHSHPSLRYPWSSKVPVVFGRFTQYLRMRHPNDTYTALAGAYGQEICTYDHPAAETCDTRAHFADWAARFNAVAHPEHASLGTGSDGGRHAIGPAALNVTETDALLLSRSGQAVLALKNVTMDVLVNGNHVSMPDHAARKYLLHLDGQVRRGSSIRKSVPDPCHVKFCPWLQYWFVPSLMAPGF